MKSGREEGLKQIRNNLIGLYGYDQGEKNYDYLSRSLGDFLSADSDSQVVPSDQFARLAGKVFAICYPDNVVDEGEPTLSTLGKILQKHFPAINGIHILPEREMSHDDLLSQDLLPFTGADSARMLITRLKDEGILDARGRVVDGYEDRCGFLAEEFSDFSERVKGLLSSRFNSHFNDGGFSQISREHVDPRFGTVDDIRNLSHTFELMLDYVVNHLDIDNQVLDAHRKGDNDGSAFIIISPERYKELKRSGEIERTFRPRPFPLFTGLRKYPEKTADDAEPADLINSLFEEKGLSPLDPRLIDFLSILFKVRNDQGLTALDKRTFDDFQKYAAEKAADLSAILMPSDLHDRQMKTVSTDLELADVCALLKLPDQYAAIFADNENTVYGEKFFVYTTFSESQADINPVSPAGFRLIVDDLFHLLSAGNLAMMRMDAIKYLWKEIGKKNFDMEEGNRLIEVIRILLELALPEMIPLDEINSPDAVVYNMAKDGGFAYLFGQVNSVPAAFNSGTLGPIERFYSMMKERCPENLVLFVMLSTHDGRSVQGLGVDRTDGHVTFGQFDDLQQVIRARGGRVKYRSVSKGTIPFDTFSKVCGEIDIAENALDALFTRNGGSMTLNSKYGSEDSLIKSAAEAAGIRLDEAMKHPALRFMARWLVEGKAPYELCSTSRDAFEERKSDGLALSPVEEARRLALAQIYVLTFGQTVPAIYFNDLLGLENDIKSLEAGGKPRDLNRHKSSVQEIEERLRSDEFTREYVPLINTILSTRVGDPAFYPGSRSFEFQALTETLFLNHAFAGGAHSFILGNIESAACRFTLELSNLAGIDDSFVDVQGASLQDLLTGDRYDIVDGTVAVDLEAYQAVWLSKQPDDHTSLY